MELLTAGWVDVAVTAAAIASAVMGGVFFAFSSFIMRALENIPYAEGNRRAATENIST